MERWYSCATKQNLCGTIARIEDLSLFYDDSTDTADKRCLFDELPDLAGLP